MSGGGIGSGVWFGIAGKYLGMEAAAKAILKDAEDVGAKGGKAFTSSFAAALGKNTEMQAAAKKEAESAASTLAAASRTVSDAQDKQAAAANRTRIAHMQLAEIEDKGTASKSRLAKAAAAVEDAEAREARAARDVGLALEDEAAKADVASAAAKRHADTLDTTGNRMSALKSIAGNVSAGIGVGLVAALVDGTKKASEFDSQMQLLTTSAGEQQSNLGALKQSVLNLQSQWGFSSSEMAGSLLTIERAGYHGADATKVLTAAVQEAHAEGAQLRPVADLLTTSMNDYGVSVGNVNTLASQQIETVKQSKVTLDEYASSIGKVEQTAHEAGMKISDLNAVFAEMTQHGITADQATDWETGLIRSMVMNPNSGQLQEWGQIGLSAKDVQNKVADPNLGLSGTSQEIVGDILKRHNEQGALSVFNKSLTAAPAEQAAYGQLDDATRAAADQFKTSGGSAFKIKQGLSGPDQAKFAGWLSAYNQEQGFNTLTRGGKNLDPSTLQEMYMAFGNQSATQAALNITGGNAAQVEAIKKSVGLAQTGPNGDVMGADKSNQTTKAREKDLAGTWRSFLTGLGEDSQGPLNKFLHGIQDVTGVLVKHKTALEIALTTIGSIGVASAGVKGLNFLGGAFGAEHAGTSMVRGIGRGIGWTAKTGGRGLKSMASGAGDLASGTRDYWQWTGKQKVSDAGKDMLGRGKDTANWAKEGASDLASGAWSGLKNGATTVKEFGKTAASASKDVALLTKANAVSGFVSAWEGLKTATAAVKDFTIAQKLAAAATAIWEGIQVGFDAVMDANPIILVTLAVVAIGAAVYEAWKHCATFRDIVKDIGKFALSVGKDIGGVFVKGFKDVSHWVGDAWSWVKKWHDVLLLAMGPVGVVIVGIEQLVKHWNDVTNALKIGGRWITGVWHDMGAAWDSFWDHDVKPAWADMQKAWNDVYNVTIKPVSNLITSAWKDIKDGAKDMVDWLDQQWNRIKGIVETPARFIVETVYDKGIAPLWNGIAHVFHLGTIPDNVHFAGGGVYDQYGTVPGYAPGRDTVAAHSNPGDGWLVPEAARAIGPNAIKALNAGVPGHMFAGGGIAANSMVSPGEARLTPAAVQAIGGAPALWALNNQYSGGRKNANGAIPGVHFDTGGVAIPDGDATATGEQHKKHRSTWGSITHAVGSAAHDVGSAVDDVAKAVGSVADWVADPVGKLKALFSKWLQKAAGTDDGGSPGNDFWKAITSVPSKMLDGAIDMIKGWFGAHPGGGLGGNEPWVSGAGAEQWVPVIKQALALEGFPTTDAYVNASKAQIMTESGGNPNISQQVHDVNSGGNEAQGLVQVTPRTAQALGLAELGGNIHDPLTNLRLGMRELKSQHGGDLLGTWGHGHGYAGGGVAGLTLREVLRFDGGGVADPNSPFNFHQSNGPKLLGGQLPGTTKPSPAAPAPAAPAPTDGSGTDDSGDDATDGSQPPAPQTAPQMLSTAPAAPSPAPSSDPSTGDPSASGTPTNGGGTGGPINAINTLKQHASTPYVWGGTSWDGLDCSSLAYFGYALATGNNSPSGHPYSTETIMGGQWPNAIRGASNNDVFIIGANDEHMLISILGTNFEERQSGETMRIGSNAKSPFDSEFGGNQWHIDPNVFNPPYTPGSSTDSPDGGTGSDDGTETPDELAADQKKTNELQGQIQKANDAVASYKAKVDNENQRAQHFLDEANADDAKAAQAKTTATRVRYTLAAQRARQSAQKAKDLAAKYQGEANAKANSIQDLRTQLGQVGKNRKSKSKDGSDSTQSLTWHDMWSRLGGVAGDAISQSTGVGDLNLESITESPLWKIGTGLSGAKFGQPYTPSIFTNPNDGTDSDTGSGTDGSDSTLHGIASQDVGKIPQAIRKATTVGTKKSEKTKTPIYDEGGLLPDAGPGISVMPVAKGVRRPERVLSPDHTEKLDDWLDGNTPDRNGDVHMVHIDHFEQPTDNPHAAGRAIARVMSPYLLRLPR